MPRTITHMLNMGNGDWSLQEVKRLHGLFDEAIDRLSGISQPIMSTMTKPPGYDVEVNRDRVAIRLIVEDLVCALLGPRARVVVDE